MVDLDGLEPKLPDLEELGGKKQQNLSHEALDDLWIMPALNLNISTEFETFHLRSIYMIKC